MRGENAKMSICLLILVGAEPSRSTTPYRGSHWRLSLVSSPVTEFFPKAEGREHKYFLWSIRRDEKNKEVGMIRSESGEVE